MTIPTRIHQIVAEHLRVDPERVTDEATFESLGADGLDGVELSIAFEEEFDVLLDDDTITETSTVGAAVEAIQDLLAKRDPHLVGGVEF